MRSKLLSKEYSLTHIYMNFNDYFQCRGGRTEPILMVSEFQEPKKANFFCNIIDFISFIFHIVPHL